MWIIEEQSIINYLQNLLLYTNLYLHWLVLAVAGQRYFFCIFVSSSLLYDLRLLCARKLASNGATKKNAESNDKYYYEDQPPWHYGKKRGGMVTNSEMTHKH